jgi:hypothetical protein
MTKLKCKLPAVILAILAAAFVWQAFAQIPPKTPCETACKTKFDECVKKGLKEAPDDALLVRYGCLVQYNDCKGKCK